MEIDFIKNAKRISAGIMISKIVSFSINIFFIAGSSSQATAEVEIADIIINKKMIKIWDNYFLT